MLAVFRMDSGRCKEDNKDEEASTCQRSRDITCVQWSLLLSAPAPETQWQTLVQSLQKHTPTHTQWYSAPNSVRSQALTTRGVLR